MKSSKALAAIERAQMNNLLAQSPLNHALHELKLKEEDLEKLRRNYLEVIISRDQISRVRVDKSLEEEFPEIACRRKVVSMMINLSRDYSDSKDPLSNSSIIQEYSIFYEGLARNYQNRTMKQEDYDLATKYSPAYILGELVQRAKARQTEFGGKK